MLIEIYFVKSRKRLQNSQKDTSSTFCFNSQQHQQTDSHEQHRLGFSYEETTNSMKSMEEQGKTDQHDTYLNFLKMSQISAFSLKNSNSRH